MFANGEEMPFIEINSLIAQRVVASAEDAAAAAEEIGGKVALKAIAPGLVHKTEAGAVRLHLSGAEAVRKAALESIERLQFRGLTLSGFVVQQMAQPGIEMLVGVVHDPQFGPVVACGAVLIMLRRTLLPPAAPPAITRAQTM